jgi:hypothetical protein
MRILLYIFVYLCAGMQHAAATGKMLEEILAGCTNPDPAQHGMTTEEERAASNVQVRSSAGCLSVHVLLLAKPGVVSTVLQLGGPHCLPCAMVALPEPGAQGQHSNPGVSCP